MFYEFSIKPRVFSFEAPHVWSNIHVLKLNKIGDIYVGNKGT